MHRARAHTERGASRRHGAAGTTPQRAAVRDWGVCVRCGCTAAGEGHDVRGAGGAGKHSNERKSAARVDCDATGVVKLCADADTVVLEASNAAAGEGGRRPGADVDKADAVVAIVLRCIGREHTLSEEQAGGAVRRAPHLRGRRCGPTGGACVRCGCAAAGGGHVTRGAGGAGHAQQRARRRRLGRLQRHGYSRTVR